MNYNLNKKFTWNDSKSESCFSKRGFDFEYASQVFDDVDRKVIEDTSMSYGEKRFQIVGQIEGRLFVVICTPRQDKIRIISARKANQREVIKHETRSNKN
jgi:uncharacterized DUF497 family protein